MFCEQVLLDSSLLTDSRFATNAARATHRDALSSLIVETFAALTADAVLTRLDTHGIANATVREMRDVWNHPQSVSRNRWNQIQTPAGMLPALRPPATLDSINPRMDAVPALGEHTDAILAELGYDASTVNDWRAVGTI